MLRTKQKEKLLPASPLALLSAIGFAEEKSATEFRLSLCIDQSLDPALIQYAKEAFRPLTDNLTISVSPFYSELPDLNPSSQLVIVIANEAPATGKLLIKALREQIPAVVVTLDPVKLQRIARSNYSEIDLMSIVTARDCGAEEECFGRLFKELGSWIARELKDELLPLARALCFVRDPFVRNAIQAACLQNAAIAAVFFLPGADMPLLTLNQVKLFLQIAAAYDAEIDAQRLKELAALLLGAVGLRTLARGLMRVVPIVKWAVRGSVAYGGTMAIGKAAQQYFENRVYQTKKAQRLLPVFENKVQD